MKHVVHVPLRGGGQFEWVFLDPAKLLSLFVCECPPVAKLFRDAAAVSPPSMGHPWHIVVGFDEFSPGNKLKVVAAVERLLSTCPASLRSSFCGYPLPEVVTHNQYH